MKRRKKTIFNFYRKSRKNAVIVINILY